MLMFPSWPSPCFPERDTHSSTVSPLNRSVWNSQQAHAMRSSKAKQRYECKETLLMCSTGTRYLFDTSLKISRYILFIPRGTLLEKKGMNIIYMHMYINYTHTYMYISLSTIILIASILYLVHVYMDMVLTCTCRL